MSWMYQLHMCYAWYSTLAVLCIVATLAFGGWEGCTLCFAACVVDVFECGSKESLSSFHTELLLKRIRCVPFWEHAGQSPGCLSVLHMLTVWFPPNQFISLHWNAKQHMKSFKSVFLYIFSTSDWWGMSSATQFLHVYVLILVICSWNISRVGNSTFLTKTFKIP